VHSNLSTTNPSSFKDISQRLALNIISGAAYGDPVEWQGSNAIPDGHHLSFLTAQRLVVDNLIPLMLLPKWLLRYLPLDSAQEIYLGYTEFGTYMKELIASEKAGETSAGLNSIVKALVQNSADEQMMSDKRLLTDEELIGNAFVILFGGHEST